MKQLFIALILCLTLTACNKQKKVYENYVKIEIAQASALTKAFGVNIQADYKCQDAEYVKTITYKDSMDLLLKSYTDTNLTTTTAEAYLTNASHLFSSLSLSYDTLKNNYEKMYYSSNGEISDLQESYKNGNESEKYGRYARNVNRDLNSFKLYNSKLNQIVGCVYVCKGIYSINGLEKPKVDSVLFTPDKLSIITVISEN